MRNICSCGEVGKGIDYYKKKIFTSPNLCGSVSSSSLKIILNIMKYQASSNKLIFKELFQLQIYAVLLSAGLLMVGAISGYAIVLDPARFNESV